MKKGIKLLAVAVMGMAVVACSSAEKMADLAQNVVVKCNPEVLEAIGGNVDADISITYPDDYFHPKAILEVTPVLVYQGGEAKMTPFIYQGEKIKDNYKVVSRNGATVNEKVHFDYVEGMEKSTLEFRGVVRYKKHNFRMPIRKVADGVNTTYMLVKSRGRLPFKADNYQEIIQQSEEGQILYLINSAQVRAKELRSQSITDFQAALDEIKANERKTLVGTEVVAYASPDGGEELNTKLSDRRSQSADKAWSSVVKNREVADPEVRSIGQDWEGFEELVQNSDIEDKDLILRVLSMYSDPEVRENEIKNMSSVYTELKSGILPELRLARFIANVEYKNYTPEELMKLVEENLNVLDEEALLRAATLVRDNDSKYRLYNQAIEKFGSDRARFNLGVAYAAAGELDKAANAFAQVRNKDADLQNALGVLALRNGDYETASNYFKQSKTEVANANQGVIDILTGNYEQAIRNFKDADGCNFNLALSYLLTGQLNQAENIDCDRDRDCARCSYLKAIIAARKGNTDDVKKYLDEVADKDKALAERAYTDIEFAEYYN